MAAAVLAGASATAEAAASAPVTASVTVSSTTGWQKTPITVTKGVNYSITYVSGTWTVDYRNFPQVGPGGYSNQVDQTIYQGCKYDPHSNYAVLLGVVGDSVAPFAIGAGGTFVAKSTGPLYLRINDDDACLSDNAGAVKMRVSRFVVVDSGIYAGYSAHPSTGTVSFALATWTVPSASCNPSHLANKSQVAVWVGLWGPNASLSTDWLPQAGTVSQCAEIAGVSQSRYEAVYQMFYQPEAHGFTPLFGVNAGDTMFAQVEPAGKGSGKHQGELRFWWYVGDQTTNTFAEAGYDGQPYLYTDRGVSLSKAAYQGGAIVERVDDTKAGVSGELPKFPAIAISGIGVGEDTTKSINWTSYQWRMNAYAHTGAIAEFPTPEGYGKFTVNWTHYK
jgi:hypothetical protein